VGGLVASLLEVYGWLILTYIVLSWVVGATESGLIADIYRMLRGVCEPYIGLFRRVLPIVAVGRGGLDMAPLVAWLVLQVVASFARRLG
jgi:YggT family protein